ncbi:DUF4249 family protein [Marinilabilia salmonicolor]|uniref:DUF4249 family protein n=1 Tax=Marinilabilia salmonicolor TaxID=989 RepID=UPI00029A5C8A|nr:DUF4249 family protein [Marinilabilia salmonicolor]
MKNKHFEVMNSFKKIIFPVLVIISTIACERIAFDPGIEILNEELPVVYGILGKHPDYRTIELTRTAPYMDGSKIATIDNAEVTVSDEQTTYSFEWIGNGQYIAPENFQPGIDTTYYLNIEIDEEVYAAQSIMPPSVNMHSLKVQKDRWETDDNNIYEVTGWVKDNEREDERFLFKYTINDIRYDSVQVWSHYTDQLSNNLWLEDAQLFGNIEANPGDTIDVYALSVSTEYYNFVQAAEKNRVSANPFTPPPGVPITGNIRNGALGIFQVSAIVQQTVTVPQKE